MMKKCLVSMFCGIAMLAVFSAPVRADFVVSEYKGALTASHSPFQVVPNDAYAFYPGIGSGSYALSVTGATPSVFDGSPSVIGSTLGSALAVTSSESLVNNGGGNYDLTIALQAAPGGSIWPSGYNVGGVSATTGGLFLGTSAGGSPIDFVNPAIVNSAFVDLYDTSGVLVTTYDISSFAILSNGPDGNWLGSLGVTFGAGSANSSIGGFALRVNYNSVPEPASALLLGLAVSGLSLIRRRS